MEIRFFNSKTLCDDLEYTHNVIHESYLIYDAVTLLELAVAHLDADVDAGLCGSRTKAQRAALKTAIRYASRYQ